MSSNRSDMRSDDRITKRREDKSQEGLISPGGIVIDEKNMIIRSIRTKGNISNCFSCLSLSVLNLGVAEDLFH